MSIKTKGGIVTNNTKKNTAKKPIFTKKEAKKEDLRLINCEYNTKAALTINTVKRRYYRKMSPTTGDITDGLALIKKMRKKYAGDLLWSAEKMAFYTKDNQFAIVVSLSEFDCTRRGFVAKYMTQIIDFNDDTSYDQTWAYDSVYTGGKDYDDCSTGSVIESVYKHMAMTAEDALNAFLFERGYAPTASTRYSYPNED